MDLNLNPRRDVYTSFAL